MHAVEGGEWDDDGMRALERDTVVLCDVIREDQRYLPARDVCTSACTGIPLVRWSSPVCVTSPLLQIRHVTNAGNLCRTQDKAGAVLVGTVCRQERSHPVPSLTSLASGTPSVPSLRSLALGYIAPFVANLAHQNTSYLPANIRATLIALARRRMELTDDILLSLVDESLTSLDLCTCVHVRPKTLVKVLARLPMLQSLDISGCTLTSEVIYSLPHRCPYLRVLRLSGTSTACVDLRAWQLLIPVVLPSTADTWEDESAIKSRGLVSLQWICWPDIPSDIDELYRRQWPKVNVNHHAYEALHCRFSSKEPVPSEALPWTCLDDGPISAAAKSAFRDMECSGHVKPKHPQREKRQAASQCHMAADSDDDFYDCVSNIVGRANIHSRSVHESLERWMDEIDL